MENIVFYQLIITICSVLFLFIFYKKNKIFICKIKQFSPLIIYSIFIMINFQFKLISDQLVLLILFVINTICFTYIKCEEKE